MDTEVKNQEQLLARALDLATTLVTNPQSPWTYEEACRKAAADFGLDYQTVLSAYSL